MQKSVAAFIEKHNLSCGENVRYIDLVSEIGELGKEIIRGCDYGKKEYTNANAKEELGDCLFSLLALCCEMNIDAEDALNFALTKYTKRFELNNDISSRL